MKLNDTVTFLLQEIANYESTKLPDNLAAFQPSILHNETVLYFITTDVVIKHLKILNSAHSFIPALFLRGQ